LEFEGVVRAVPVVVMEEVLGASGRLVAVGISVSVGPLAQGGLDEALGFAVGLGRVIPL
jgi:hypothetical protein